MQIMAERDFSPYKDEADKIRKVLDAPPANYPLGRETMYAQMLGAAEMALRDAEVTRQGFLADEATIGKLVADLAAHKECLPREAVEALTDSKLPCGHPNACGTSDATGARIRCAWCDEVMNLKKAGAWILGVDFARQKIQEKSKELMEARPRKLEWAGMLDTVAMQLVRFTYGESALAPQTCSACGNQFVSNVNTCPKCNHFPSEKL